MNDRSRSSAATGRMPWLAITLFSAVVTGLVCYPAWPGLMSYDSLFAYQQARYGVETSTWPPMHTYLFQVSRALGADTWGLLLFQSFILLFGAATTLRVLVPRRALAWTLSLFFAGGLVYFPVLLGSMMVHWRDVTTGSFAILGLGLWLTGARDRKPILLVTALVAMGLSMTLRYNAFVLVLPMMALMVWRPYLDDGRATGARIIVGASLALTLAGAWATSQWRLPDLTPLPKVANFSAIQEFDVIGVSACTGRNYLPPGITAGQPITVAQIRRAYDPRHLLMTLAPQPGVPRMLDTDAGGAVQKRWAELVLSEPGCYLDHRRQVFVEQMGMAKDGVFYPVHGVIDANPFGLVVRDPAATQLVSNYIGRNASDMWRRPFLLYAAAAVLGLAAALSGRRTWLMLSLLAGAFAYPALLFLVGPAADARYIFPSNALCLLIALAGLGLLASPRRAAS